MTTTSMKFSFLAASIALLAAACDDPDALNGSRVRAPGDDDPGAVAAALQCTEKPEGRSFLQFDGSKLEDTRTNENAGLNRARVKPYGVMAAEYQRVLGSTPEAIKTAASSFDAPEARWFAEASYSGVSMDAIYNISYSGCLTYARGSADLKAAPTTESATAECTKLMRKAWSRSPSPEEIQGCTDLAVTKLATQTDVSRRWAYVCSSVLSSSQFLTF